MINSYAIYIEKLQPEYKTVFKTITDYVNACSPDAIRTEELLSDVMDMFLSAQSEGKSPDQVTGGNLKSFCEHLCADIGIKSRILSVLEMLHPMFLFYTLICIFDLLDFFSRLSDGEAVSFLTYPAEINLWIFLLGIGAMSVSGYIGKGITKACIFNNPEKYKFIARGIRFGTCAVFIAVLLFVFRYERTEGMLLWIALLCCTVFLTAYRLLTRKSRQYRRENRISFQELTGVSMDIRNDIEELEMKRFEKLKSKHQRKNLPELTFAEFLAMEEKNCNRWDKKPAFYVIIAVGGTLCGLFTTLYMSGFEHFYDMIFFIAVMLAVEGAVMYGLFRLTDAGTKARLNWIHSKQENAAE